MRNASSFVRPSLFAVFTACAVAGSTTGCLMVQHDDEIIVDPGPSHDRPADVPKEVAIDIGTTLDVTGGDGAGLYVQYAEDTDGGHWTIFTSCDVNTKQNPSGIPCSFDVFTVPLDETGAISNIKGKDISPKDLIEVLDDGTLYFFAETSDGLNGISFDTKAGATLRMEMFLDGVRQPEFVYWVGDGIIHTGAPTDPVDFVPKG